MAKEEAFSDNLMAYSGGAPIKYSDNISFGSAFADARKKFGEEGLFIWRDKIYSTKGKGLTAENQFNPQNSQQAQNQEQQQSGEGEPGEEQETSEEAPEEETTEEAPTPAPKKQPALKKANNNQ